ncbi:glutamate permease [Mycetocola reblochoni REB411]|uniref:Glutamate permease n=2 Tax=Mycetocola reblochoni TaxID=331618 RepID=A0A1R4IDT7_9MICO|nr:glutamate permease [Mycetocola reblochoni REB411]
MGGEPMTTVLYDVPGPKAIARNRVIAVATVLLAAAVIGFVVYRFAITGQFDARKWELFTYPQVWERIGSAIVSTLSAFALGAVLSLALGFALAIGRLSEHAWVRVPCAVFTELFRAVPLLILMMIIYYGLPPLGVQGITPYAAVVAGLTLYNGSVLAEVFRAGILSLPPGQAEAGYAIGMRKSGVMSIILIPQAVRAMLPVIIAQLVVILKDTALGFLITYQELLFTAKFLSSQQSFDFPVIPVTIVVSIIYIGLCLILSAVAKLVELRIRRGSRRAVPADEEPPTQTEAMATVRR